MVHFNNDWDEVLAGEFNQEYYKRIRYFLKQEYAEQTVYPPMEYIFNALRLTPSSVKAVILGQDPYHGPGQAHGLCFSVQPGVKVPPSLQNIYKELKSDLGIEPPKDGTLTKWAKQGVLMLNTTLTVRAGQANSHKNLGWTTFTDHVLEKAERSRKSRSSFCSGAAMPAARPGSSPRRSILCSRRRTPPLSPRTTAFFGCHHFSMCNDYLRSCGLTPIDWDLNTP